MPNSIPPPTVLFDADRSSAAARAAVAVGDAVTAEQVERAYEERAKLADYRLDVVTRYSRAVGWEAEMAVLAEAAEFDKAHPFEPSLADELHGMTLGLVA